MQSKPSPLGPPICPQAISLGSERAQRENEEANGITSGAKRKIIRAAGPDNDGAGFNLLLDLI